MFKMPNIDSKVPLLNEYKEEFFWKRVPQSLLGGPKLRLGYDAPAYVYINQVLIFIVPAILAGIFNVLSVYGILQSDIALYIVGALTAVYALTLQLISFFMKRKKSAVTPSSVNNTKNMLKEEDEILFESCCGLETIEFIIPGKKYKINIIIHSLLAGVVAALAFRYLLPTTIKGLFNDSEAAAAIICILGWITVCIALYSLTVAPPPEPAAYRTVDIYEIASLTRPFYILLLCCANLLATYAFPGNPGWLLVDQILHVVFVFLPVLWLLGFLPPVDAAFLWFWEQQLVFIFGGSPMASDIRLLVMVVASVCVSVAVFYIPVGIATIIIISAFGYLCSIDLSSLCCQLLNLCFKNKDREKDQSYVNLPSGFLWRWGIREVIFHGVMFAITVGLATGLYFASSSASFSAGDIPKALGYAFPALLGLAWIFGEVQSVYQLGLLRNCFYPKSADRTAKFLKRKKILNVFGFIRRVIINILSPLAMLVYLTLSVKFASTTSSSSTSNSTADAFLSYLDTAGNVRAFRWIWQSTQYSLLELSVLHIITYAVPASSWSSLSVSIRLIIISLCRDRLLQLINKSYFMITVLVKSWSDKKQRHKWTIPLIITNAVLFPFLLVMLLGAVLLSAPLLPLFTMPLFIIGFLRPMRFWSSQVGASANVGEDTTFYKHVAPQLADAFRVAFANGSIGEAIPGKHYLVRFQDRLAWVTILELGYRYCTIGIKGLELQETSCHTVEATRLDDQIQLAFEPANGASCCIWNKYPASAVTPHDAAIIKTYSDAKNVLTGVIDSPDTTKNVTKGFSKTLIWLLTKHVAKLNGPGNKIPPKRPLSALGKSKVSAEKPNIPQLPDKGNKKDESLNFRDTWESGIFEASVKSGLANKDKTDPRMSPSVKSFNSLWSDDNESLLLEPIGNNKKQEKPNLTSGVTKGRQTETVRIGSGVSARSNVDSPRTLTTNLTGSHLGIRNSDDIDALVNDLDFGLPAVDVTRQSKPVSGKPYTLSNQENGVNTLPTLTQVNNLPVPNFSCKYSEKLLLPDKWRDSPVDQTLLSTLTNLFDSQWFKHVISLLDLNIPEKSHSEVASEIIQDPVLVKMYSHLVMSCYAIVNIIGVGNHDTSMLSTSHVYKVYTGDIPWSPALDWLIEEPQLFDLVHKAYRYSVKLAIDQMLLGEVSSEEELQEYLEEYDKDWYIGSEKEEGWKQAVVKGKPQLFSLTYDSSEGGVYSSRTLSNQDLPVHISSVNAETVRGQWANLALELLYMTNDDEERYSIQAHATLMRNLTVQAADPPLGYPVFASQPISVPIL